MAKHKNVIAIFYSNSTLCLNYTSPKKIKNIKLYENKNSNHKAIIINQNYYKENADKTNEQIYDLLKMESVDVIIPYNASILTPINKYLKISTNSISIYIPNNVVVSNDNLESLNSLKKCKEMIFEKTISIDTANTLDKLKIPFKTIASYRLFNTSKINGDTKLYSFSDYYNLKTLKVNANLTEEELSKLNNLFSFNKKLKEINLKCDIDNALKIVNNYISRPSHISKAKVVLQLKTIVTSKAESMALYKIYNLLNANKSQFNIEYKKERVTYLEYISTINPLKEYAFKINAAKLSPIEKLILIDDYTKAKPYNDCHRKQISRNFFSSLNSEFVVCYTYSYTFKALCDMCGVPSTIANSRLVFKSNIMSEHCKVICNITDPKYNYNGILQFEPTNDSAGRKPVFMEEQPKDNYLYFGNTLRQVHYFRNMTSTEFGIFNIALTGLYNADEQDVKEAIRQVNELTNADLNANTPTPIINTAIISTVNKINMSAPLTLDVFKSALTTARNIVSDFSDADMHRILEINRYKCTFEMECGSKNMFEYPLTKVINTKNIDATFNTEKILNEDADCNLIDA